MWLTGGYRRRISRPETCCTATDPWRPSGRSGSSRFDRCPQRFGKAARPPRPDADDEHFSGGKDRSVAPQALRKPQRRPAHLDSIRLDPDEIVHQSGQEEIDLHGSNDEGDLLRLVKRALVDPERADELGAPTLEEPQVVRVVDHAREVGVLIVDAEREDMSPVFDPPRLHLVTLHRTGIAGVSESSKFRRTTALWYRRLDFLRSQGPVAMLRPLIIGFALVLSAAPVSAGPFDTW